MYLSVLLDPAIFFVLVIYLLICIYFGWLDG